VILLFLAGKTPWVTPLMKTASASCHQPSLCRHTGQSKQDQLIVGITQKDMS